MKMSNFELVEFYYLLIRNLIILISSLEIVGRFPSEEEADAFHISEDTPVWLPVNTKELNEDVKLKNKLIRKLNATRFYNDTPPLVELGTLKLK